MDPGRTYIILDEVIVKRNADLRTRQHDWKATLLWRGIRSTDGSHDGADEDTPLNYVQLGLIRGHAGSKVPLNSII